MGGAAGTCGPPPPHCFYPSPLLLSLPSPLCRVVGLHLPASWRGVLAVVVASGSCKSSLVRPWSMLPRGPGSTLQRLLLLAH